MVDKLEEDGANVQHRSHLTALTAAKLTKQSLLVLKWRRSNWERHKLASELSKADRIIAKLSAAGAEDPALGLYINVFRIMSANHGAVRIA